MKENQNTDIIPQERIINRIFVIRGRKVMLDRDLAELYGVETRELNQAVRRNTKRFPEDFMFQLSKQEMENWKSQIMISNLKSQIVTSSWGGRRKLPFAFTDYGVLMLSSVLKSERAIQVNVQVVRTFAKLQEILSTHHELRKKIEEMERKYDGQFREVFEALIDKGDNEPPRRIGFRVE